MNIFKYRNLFIRGFFFGKLFLVCFAFFLSWADAYTHNQMIEIISIISPTLVASLIIILNFLKSTRNLNPDSKENVTKTEVIIVFSSLIFYFFSIIALLFSLQAESQAFLNMKNNIALIESIFGGGVLGWVVSDLKSATLKKSSHVN